MGRSGQLQSDRPVRAEPIFATTGVSYRRKRQRLNQPTGHVRLALVLLERAPKLGVARDTLLRDAKLDERQLRDPSGRIPLAAIARLWRSVASHVQDPTAGLRVGADIHVREFGIVGYAMAFSSTVASALTRVSRYSRILSNAHALIMETAGEATWVRLDMQPELRAFRLAVDYRLAAVLSACREIAASPIAPLLVQLPYRRPPDVKEYVRFFDGPLEFSSLGAALLFRNDDLARPNALADNKLTSYLDRLAEQVLASVGGEGTLRERVRRALWSELSEGVPALPRLARTLGMSDRTLQRQLREEGTTFAALLTELRREMAPPLLLDGRLAVSEVAFLLGYEDPSAFRRAFHRWFGRSPRAYRRAGR
jgi:AraC-like DNA-binding protein